MINRQFFVHRGDTWPGFILTVTAADPVNDPVDFTGATASSDIRETPDGVLVVSPDIDAEATAESVTVAVSLTAAKSALIQGTVVSDVQIALADGRIYTALAYKLNVTSDVARGGAGAVHVKTYNGGLVSGFASCGPITATVVTAPVPVTPGASPTSGPVQFVDLICPDDSTVYRLTIRLNLNDQAVLNIQPAP